MRRIAFHQLREERGASAIVVAIVLVVLVGFGALAVDLGALYSDKKQVQNGADAAALAVAQTCADGACTPAIAPSYLTGNKFDGNVRLDELVDEPVLIGDGTVQVFARTTRDLGLANVLGFAEAEAAADATASWGAMSGGSTIPLVIAACAFDEDYLDDPDKLIWLKTKSTTGYDPDENPCLAPGDPHVVPGGFHWLMPTEGCTVESDVNDRVPTSPGNTNPNSCPAAELNALLRSGEVLVPMFDYPAGLEGTGSNATYRLVGYAAIVPTAYCLTSHVHWNTQPSGDRKCTGSERWLEAYFVRKVPLDGITGGSPVNAGVTVVKLTD